MGRIASILKRILATKCEEISAGKLKHGMAELMEKSKDLPSCRGFSDALVSKAEQGPAVIAEIKKASPSAGVIRENFDPASIAQSYEEAGAACLSVLTDREYFQGSEDYLRAASSACTLPVLRKDFIIDPWQVYESRVMGADCILLIVAALSAEQLKALYGLAKELGLDVLVEVHDESELETALETPARLIGVNNRDLHHFTTDLNISERLRPMIPHGRCMITESGIHTRSDVQRMRECGIHSFLVGEAFMRVEDPGEALRGLFF